LDVRLEVEAGFENVTGHPELTLFIGPGDVDASVHVTCSNGGSSTEKVIDYGALWRGAFSDRARPDGTLRFDILPPFGQHLGGTVFATYGPDTRPFEYAWGYGKVTASETVRFTLRHVPAP